MKRSRKLILKPTRGAVCGLGIAVLLCWSAAGQTNVGIPDPNLRSAVLSALGRTNGLITDVDLLAVTNLSCWATVTNLSGLESAQNLQQLLLYRGNPSSLAPLTGLPNLRGLGLEHTTPQNLGGLISLTALTNLDLYASPLTNVGFLIPLTNLVSLDVSFSKLTDPSPLASLPRLQVLDLSGDPLGNCANLASLTNLPGTLYLDTASLTNVEGLAGLTNLNQLSLYQNPVQDVAPVSNLVGLAALDLGYVSAQDFSVLAGLTNLQRLYVDETSLTNLNRLPALPSLNTLDATYNRLNDLSAIARWPKLQSLNLSYNRLADIAALGTLTNLATVYVQVNLLNTNDGPTMAIINALTNQGATVYYVPQHQPPAITVPGPALVPADEVSSLAFSAADDLTPGNQLLVEARSANPALLSVAVSSTPVLGFPGQAVAQMASFIFPSPPNPPSIPGRSGYLNLTPIANQTGTTTITITVTDETGLATQTNVTVTIVEPASFDGTAAGSTNTNLSWKTFGSSQWQGETNVVHTGSSAAQSGTSDSWLEADITGPGMLQFWWRAAGTNFGDGAMLTATCAGSGLVGHATLSQTGFYPAGAPPSITEWQPEKLSLPAGRWVLRWQPSQGPFDKAPVVVWVAEVSFVPGPPQCWLETPSSGNASGFFLLNLFGPPGETYDVETSPDLRAWSKLQRRTMTDFRVFFADPAGTAPVRFYRLHKPALAPIWLEAPGVDKDRNLQLTIHSEPQQPLSIEWSTNLLNWATLVQTNNPGATLQIGDGPVSAASQKFYRAKALPWWQLLIPPTPAMPFNISRRHQLVPLPLSVRTP